MRDAFACERMREWVQRARNERNILEARSGSNITRWRHRHEKDFEQERPELRSRRRRSRLSWKPWLQKVRQMREEQARLQQLRHLENRNFELSLSQPGHAFGRCTFGIRLQIKARHIWRISSAARVLLSI